MLSWLELPVESSVTSFPATFKTSFSGFSTYPSYACFSDLCFLCFFPIFYSVVGS
uniref:Uncharacterized protein n=1 Tax=Anguilla anguilla TaxID=7936 RepID=A0A0E9PDH2_ANGAN